MKNLYKIENELYIVDNTEEINKDTKICWCINTSNNEVVLHQGVLPAYHYKYYKKITMTTNTSINLLCGCGKNCGAKESGIQAINKEFLEWLVKNPSCEFVEVEKENICARCYSNDVDECWSAKECSDGKYDKTRYKIIIPQEKPKINLEKLPFPELIEELVNYHKDTFLVEEKNPIKLFSKEFILGFLEYIEGTYSYSNIFDHWYLHADTSKSFSRAELFKEYQKNNPTAQ
jgi:hypothetical protein